MIGTDHLHRLRHGSLRILDKLCLVQHADVEGQRPVQCDIPLQRIVGADQYIDLTSLQRAKNLFSGRKCAAHHCGPQCRRKPPDLLLPVEDQRSRAYNQRRLCHTTLLVRENYADHLQRLPQAHLIGQDAAKASPFQCFQPFKALVLIGTDRILQRLRHLILRVPDRAEIPDQGTVGPVSGRRDCIMLLQQAVQIQGPV